jgi:hypothetical protein
MSGADLGAAAAIAAAAAGCGVCGLERAVLVPDRHGTPPIHALLGLHAPKAKPAKLGDDALLRDKLAAALDHGGGTALLQARDRVGHSVFESYVAGGGSTARGALLLELLHFPVVVAQCLQGSEDELDAFVCSMLRGSTREAALFCTSVVQQAVGDALEPEDRAEGRRVARRFMQACVRVFVTLCSSPGRGLKARRETLMAMFETGAVFAIATVRARPGRLGALRVVLHSKSVLCGVFVLARRVLSSPKRRFLARAAGGDGRRRDGGRPARLPAEPPRRRLPRRGARAAAQGL